MSPAVRKAWTRAFVKEIKGILVERMACELAEPLPSDRVIPIMDVYQCKLDKNGLIDKLKVRAVFRGDLYQPKEDMDPWNPHASFLSLKIFLATCAKLKMRPVQADMLLAYLQADMRERVFVKFPESWKAFLPGTLHQWIGRPVL